MSVFLHATILDMKKCNPLIIGNWKLNPASSEAALTLAQAVGKAHKNPAIDVAIAPPFLYINDIKKKLGKSIVTIAAQNVSTEPLGAFTGEVSAAQLEDARVSYVIIGHSERRAMGETDEQVQKKLLLTLKHKMIPVVCIGEKSRDSQGLFYTLIEAQIRSLASVLNATLIKKVVIAYEPIWAIGTGKTATAEDVKEMQLFIFSVLAKLYDRATANKVQLIYGGSVKPDNALSLHTEGGMDGFLVGGASLKAEDFISIIKATESK
jgi:triosephosphate isomerase